MPAMPHMRATSSDWTLAGGAGDSDLRAPAQEVARWLALAREGQHDRED